MSERIPKWAGTVCLTILLAVSGWVGTRGALQADVLEARAGALECRLAASEQDRKDIRESLRRVEDNLQKLVDMYMGKTR